jgi:riboflavin kinase/FMN adenylyltransferase
MKTKTEVFSSTHEARDFLKHGSVVTIGNYDGVHFGHRQILKTLRKRAHDQKLKSVVLTFEPHPVTLLSPSVAPKRLNTREQKVELLSELGVDAVILQNFDLSFSKRTPEDFFQTNLIQDLQTKLILVGHDFTFGAKRKGTIETLEILAYAAKIGVEIVSAQFKDKTLVSSTLIRKLVSEGNVTLAEHLLERPYFIDGTVVHGHKRGTALGIHTANLNSQNELLPLDGVYATLVEFKGKIYDSATNIGHNPTFHNVERSVETHLFSFAEEIYGKNLRLFFIERLRGEIQFASPEALIKQIQKDIVTTQSVLKAYRKTHKS